MKATGVTRPIDNLGRIVLPMELRRNMNLKEKDALEIYTEQDKIILRKYNPSMKTCVRCGKNVAEINMCNLDLCKQCDMETYEYFKRLFAEHYKLHGSNINR